MPYQEVPIEDLRVNRANDRHGELIDESAAISELFRLYDERMRNLATDIEEQRAIYDPPLVHAEDGVFVVFDGNRRVTCLKLILEPHRAPTQDLQQFFRGLHDAWQADLPQTITCQVEEDRDVIDAILHRRHTGSQKGVGQIDWNNRAKLTFAERTGRGGSVNVAAEIERFLTAEDRLPEQAIPWSTLTRLLSSEEFRNRVGAEHELQVAEGLSRRVGAVAASLRDRQIINEAYFDEINRIRRDDALISIPSMHRYIHSPDFAPMEGELRAYWARLGRFLVACLAR